MGDKYLRIFVILLSLLCIFKFSIMKKKKKKNDVHVFVIEEIKMPI